MEPGWNSCAELAGEWNSALLATPAAGVARAEALDAELSIGPYRHPEGPIPLRPVLLPAEFGAELARLSRTLLRLVRDVCTSWAAGVFELAERIGYRPPDVSLLTDDPAVNAYVLDMARPDVVISGGIPRFVESNITSAMAGPEQLTRLNRRFRADFPLDPTVLDRLVVPDALAGRREAMLRAARARGVTDPAVCLLGWADEGFGSPDYFADVINDFTAQGVDCECAIPNVLESAPEALTLKGKRIDIALLMFIAADAGNADLELSPLREALRLGTAPTLSPELAEVYSSKKALAWLSESAPALPPGDRDFVERHVPWTRVVADTRTTWQDTEIALLDLLAEHQHGFILKPFDKHGGEGAVAGRDVDAPTWADAVARAAADGHFIVQRFFPPDPLQIPVYRPATNEVGISTAAAVFSPLLMRGELGGVLVRHTDTPTTSIVNAVGGGVMNTVWFPH